MYPEATPGDEMAEQVPGSQAHDSAEQCDEEAEDHEAEWLQQTIAAAD